MGLSTWGRYYAKNSHAGCLRSAAQPFHAPVDATLGVISVGNAADYEAGEPPRAIARTPG